MMNRHISGMTCQLPIIIMPLSVNTVYSSCPAADIALVPALFIYLIIINGGITVLLCTDLVAHCNIALYASNDEK